MTSLIEKARELDAEYNLRSICKSKNINEWSFHKPMNSNSRTYLTDSDRYALNDGFMLFTFFNPRELMYALQHPNASNIWKYEDRVAPYRLNDFDGYMHSGDMDFSLSFITNSYGSQGDTLRLAFNYSINELMLWDYFDGLRMADLDIVLLIYENGTVFDASGTRGLWVYKICSMQDYDDKLNITIPNDLGDDTYEIRLAFTTATQFMDNKECLYNNQQTTWVGNWYAMPELCKTLMTVTSNPPTPGGPGNVFDYVDFESFTYCNFSFVSPLLFYIHITNEIELTDNTKDYTVTVNYYYTNRRRGELLLYNDTFVLDSNNLTQTENIRYNTNIEVMSDAQLNNDIINIKIYASIKDNVTDSTQTQSWSKNIEKTVI